MFITRATRREHADVMELLTEHERGDADLAEGVTFIAREGAVVGCVRVVEVEPRTVVVDNVLVHAERRGEGVGRRLMETAMNSRGGTLYLCCHDDVIPFYAKFGFTLVALDEAPHSVVAYWEKIGDIPTDPNHVHHYMKAR
ncbi:MAG: GNAT family N-acetyltransferase [Actinomycetota bacterium]